MIHVCVRQEVCGIGERINVYQLNIDIALCLLTKIEIALCSRRKTNNNSSNNVSAWYNGNNK